MGTTDGRPRSALKTRKENVFVARIGSNRLDSCGFNAAGGRRADKKIREELAGRLARVMAMGVYTLGGGQTRQPVRTRKRWAFFHDLPVNLPVRKRQQSRQHNCPRSTDRGPQSTGHSHNVMDAVISPMSFLTDHETQK